MKLPWPSFGSPIMVALCTLLISGCTQGSITTQDEPPDAEEQSSDPDGGDELQADGDGQTPDDGDSLGDDADASGTDDMQGDDGQAQGDDGQTQGDDGQTQGDDGQAGDDDVQGDDGPDPSSEMLLFDGDGRQFTESDRGFHALINPGDQLPSDNWLEPIDYYNGEFHVRYVINSPPDQVAGKLQTCIWTMGDDGVGGNYFPESCGQQVSHTGVGEYFVTNNITPADWWKNQGVALDYSHPERFLIRVVLRGESGCNVTDYDVSGSCWELWEDYQDMNFRVTIVMVGQGETFSGWANYP